MILYNQFPMLYSALDQLYVRRYQAVSESLSLTIEELRPPISKVRTGVQKPWAPNRLGD